MFIGYSETKYVRLNYYLVSAFHIKRFQLSSCCNINDDDSLLDWIETSLNSNATSTKN